MLHFGFHELLNRWYNSSTEVLQQLCEVYGLSYNFTASFVPLIATCRTPTSHDARPCARVLRTWCAHGASAHACNYGLGNVVPRYVLVVLHTACGVFAAYTVSRYTAKRYTWLLKTSLFPFCLLLRVHHAHNFQLSIAVKFFNNSRIKDKCNETHSETFVVMMSTLLN